MAQIIGTGKQRAGKLSRIVVGAAVLAMKRFNCNVKGDDIDTVNFNSLGYGEGILGILDLDWDFNGDWDAGMNPFANVPGIYPRDDLTGLGFEYNSVDSVGITLPYARIRTTKVSTMVRESVTFEASGMNQGTFTVGTASV